MRNEPRGRGRPVPGAVRVGGDRPTVAPAPPGGVRVGQRRTGRRGRRRLRASRRRGSGWPSRPRPGHQRGHQPPEPAQPPRAAGGDDRDADEQVPADVQAGQRGVLVDEGGRLQHPIGVGVLGDRVDQSERAQPRWRHRIAGEEHQPRRPRDHHRVAQPQVDDPVPQRQPQQHHRDHRPVPPDVDPVGDVGQPLMAYDDRLHEGLVLEAEPPLERDHLPRVLDRQRRPAIGQPPHTEVHDDPQRDQAQLAEQPARTPVDSPRIAHRAPRTSVAAPVSVCLRVRRRSNGFAGGGRGQPRSQASRRRIIRRQGHPAQSEPFR